MTARQDLAAAALPHCCRSGRLRHCHGTLIVHRDQMQECTIDGRTTPAEGHELVLTCTETFTECMCGPS